MALISNVRLWKRAHDTVKASGKFTVANAFDVSFTLVNSSKGLFVSLPRRQYDDKKTGETKWVNEVFCLSEEARVEMTKAVMDAYENDALPSSSSSATKEQPKEPVKTSKKVPF